MNALTPFTLPLSGMSFGMHEFHFHVDRDFFACFEASPLAQGDMAVELSCDKRSDMLVLVFRMKGTVRATCDRCLDEFDLPIDVTHQLLVKYDDDERDEAEVVYIHRDTPRFNVARFVYEFILISMPMIVTHDHGEGECNPDMLRFITTEEELEAQRRTEAEATRDDDDDEGNDLWNQLKDLIKQN